MADKPPITLYVTIPESLNAKLEREIEVSGCTKSFAVRRALEDWLITREGHPRGFAKQKPVARSRTTN